METSDRNLRTLIHLIDRARPNRENPLTPESRLNEDAGLDSLSLIELAEVVEQEMNVVLRPEDYSSENFATVQSVFALINRRMPS